MSKSTSDSSAHPPQPQSTKQLIGVSLAALGVVFGDIGTSPLYAIKECFAPGHGLPLTDANVFGILSLVFWSLALVVTVKYLVFILRADNKGEGGIIALLALLLPTLKAPEHRNKRYWIAILGIVGAALLYGDGVITPAISVLSAVEGLEIATPAFSPYVVPITLAILVMIFLVQSRGTAKIGLVFGPLVLLWFITIAAVALPWIIKRPEILASINPLYAVAFFAENGIYGFLVLSAVVLCVTGGEALYADMGHFGKRPIRLSWFWLVLPALLINYFGQGALILEQGQAAIGNPFYGLVNGWLLYPLVAIATMATVIASQALISGAYSLTQQAVQLGYLPRLTILHTSRTTEGQIYVPRVNSLLMIGCLTLVIVFKESSALAAAYGIAVTGTMVITTILYCVVTRMLWKWSWAASMSLLIGFLFVDIAFFSANIVKVFDGGWVPILIAGAVATIMLTWKRGREIVSQSLVSIAKPLTVFLQELEVHPPQRVKGTAVFMTLTQDIAPAVLLHHFKHNQVLHEKMVLLSIVTKNEPEIPHLRKVRVTELSSGFYKVLAHYGYMQTPDISEILALCESSGLPINRDKLSFYMGRETFLPTGKSQMARWRKKLFIFLSKNARPANEFFRIPADHVIEIGSQIRL